MTLLLSVGINIDDARIPDNKGNQPIDVAIQEDGAPAYFSNLPVKTMTEAIKAAGVPASLSNTAGTFVCNHVLYQLGYLADKSYPGLLFGFIHVPFIPEQVTDKPEKPSMSIETIAKGLTAAIKAISKEDDAKVALGETQKEGPHPLLFSKLENLYISIHKFIISKNLYRVYHIIMSIDGKIISNN